MFKRFDLREELTSTIAWFEQHYDHARLAVPV